MLLSLWSENRVQYSDSGALFLRIGNLSTTSVDLKLEKLTYVQPPEGAEGERTRVRAGDLLISITALIGAAGVVPDTIDEAYVNQHTALVRPRHELVISRWAAYCLHSALGKHQFSALSYGGTKEGLTLNDVAGLYILYPPRQEQEAIVARLDAELLDLDEAIQTAKQEINLIREYRARLIADVVTGKLDVRGVAVPDVEDTEADVRLDAADGDPAPDEEALAEEDV